VGVSENGGIAWKSSSTKAELALVFASEARSFADMFLAPSEAGVAFFFTQTQTHTLSLSRKGGLVAVLSPEAIARLKATRRA
jgi:photosystem II stability/assembly factor-like uncharacterized protein